MPESTMHYWRCNSFDKLEDLQRELANEDSLYDYREYLWILEMGLRSDALRKIDSLLTKLQALPDLKKRSLASLLLRACEHETGHRLLPHPLREKFIQPVLKSWREALPDDPEPLRWSASIDDLARALTLEPACDYTRRKLILRILGFVGFSTHELPSGYLGNITEDLDLIALARREAELILDKEARTKYIQMLDEEESDIASYLTSHNGSQETTKQA